MNVSTTTYGNLTVGEGETSLEALERTGHQAPP